MTRLPLPSGRLINLDLVTHCEEATWHESNDPRSPVIEGIVIYFVGGSCVRLSGQDAVQTRKFLCLTVH